MSGKIFLKLNFNFIVAKIREVFGNVVCVCVCRDPVGLHDKSVVFYLISVGFEIVAATVFCSAKARFWMTFDAILIPKIYDRLQKIASNISKFSGGGPQTPAGARAFGAQFRASPPYRPTISKIFGSAPECLCIRLMIAWPCSSCSFDALPTIYNGVYYIYIVDNIAEFSPPSANINFPITVACITRLLVIGRDSGGSDHWVLARRTADYKEVRRLLIT